MLNERVGEFHDLAAHMLQIESAFIAELQQNRRKMLERFLLGGLKEQENLVTFSRIYDKKAEKPLTGKEARSFWEKVQ
jgi:hypothetical protein